MEEKLREVKDMMVIGFFAGRDIDSETKDEIKEWYADMESNFKSGRLDLYEIEEFKEYLFEVFS